ncbi:MAG: universal stress protein [Acidobacteria bacterium]|nr:universal stress protein [Acidobacteriota bacterium]
MYSRILVAVEHSPADRTIIHHVRQLARLCGSELLLVHVADGWAARNIEQLDLRDSEEIRDDRDYLEKLVVELNGEGLKTAGRLAFGDPATELVRVAREERVDLVAMATHGHRYLADIVHGATADRVRHALDIPVLMLRAAKEPA